MYKTNLILFAVIFFLLVFFGCGEKDKSGESAVSNKMNPEELGKNIGQVYGDAITEVTDLMSKREDVAVAQPKVAELKEKIIQKMVLLGKQREALEATDRSTVDRFIRMGISSISMDIYNTFREGHKHYAGLDINLGNLIASFNIITQYANFDLLKKQNPAEAKRLGIE